MTVRTIRASDEPAYRAAVRRSQTRLTEWNPVDPGDLLRHLAGQGPTHRTFLLLANEPDPEQPLVGKVNVSNVVYGRSRSATLGYDAYDPYAGRGLFLDGLRLVVDLALTSVTDGGLGLHRVEANVQPGNARSAGVLRALGFQREGASQRLLWLPDREGREAWRDHLRFAVTSQAWPAAAYAPVERSRVVALLDVGHDSAAGPDEAADAGEIAGQQARSAARAVSSELGLPLLPADLPGLDVVVASCPAGALVVGELGASALAEPLAVLRASEPAAVLVTRAELEAAAATPAGPVRLALGLSPA